MISDNAYIILKRWITVAGTSNADKKKKKKLTVKNNASFGSCISKYNYRFINNAEDLDVLSQYIIC